MTSDVRLLALVIASVASAACFPNPPGLCQTQADCKEGTTCTIADGATEGLCLSNATVQCDKNCGEGFECRLDGGGAQQCVLSDGQTFAVTVTAPADGAVVPGTRSVTLTCGATGPQVKGASFLLTGPGDATANEVPAVLTGTDWTATWEPSTAAEGAWTIACRITAGPDGVAEKRDSSAVHVTVDKTGPVVTHTAPTGWHKRDGTLNLGVQVSDATAGLEASGLVLVVGSNRVVADALSNGTAIFELDLVANTAASIEGALQYGIEATDRVGNVSNSGPFSVNVDGVAPVVTLTLPGGWVARASATATVGATASGAPVVAAGAQVREVGGTHTFNATSSGSGFTASIDAAQLVASGESKAVSLDAIVLDEAGNQGVANAAQLQVDDAPPVITIVDEGRFYRIGPGAQVAVTVTDAGAGVGSSSVQAVVTGAGTGACTPAGGNTYTCTIGTGSLANSATTLAYELRAQDLLGKAGTKQATLHVDGLGPDVSIAADSGFHASGESLTLEVTLSDAGAGAAETPAPTLQFVSASGPVLQGTKVSGSTFRFGPVAASTLVPGLAGKTGVDVVARVVAQDAVGNETTNEGAVKRSFDFQAPTVSGVSVAYPANPVESGKLLRREVDPARLSGVRRDRATITTTIRDGATNATGQDIGTGSGIDPATARLRYTRNDGTQASVAPASTSGDTYTFTFDAADVKFANTDAAGQPVSADGSVAFTIAASDRAANQATAGQGTVAVTRKLWDVLLANATVNQAVAIDANNVYATLALDGSFAANVYAINRATGSTTWSGRATGSPKTPPVVGTGAVHFVSEVASIATHTGFATSSSGTAVAQFACALDGQFSGALAFQSVTWRGSSSASDTVFLHSNSSQLTASRSSCDAKFSIVSFDASASSTSISSGLVYAGTSASRLGRSTYNLSNAAWVSATGVSGGPSSTIQVTGTPVSSDGSVFMALSGQLFKIPGDLGGSSTVNPLGFSGNASSQPSLLAAASILLPSITSGVTVADAAGATTAVTIAPMSGVTLLQVASTPAVGRDSSAGSQIYFGSSGGRFTSAAPSGAQAWTYTGTGNVLSPKIGCNGVAYAGTSAGRVFALVTDSTGPADTPWPTFQHDNRNTGNTATPIYSGGVCQE